MPSGSDVVGLLAAAVLCLIFRYVVRRKAASAAGGGAVEYEEPVRRRLPPGSMGWPYIGETLQLYSSKNPNSFFDEKQRRYGAVFKTHILGCHCVMMSSPEAARFVLVTKAHLFKPTFPASKERMLGPQAIFFQRGDYHARLRRLVLRAFMPDAIRSKVSSIEDAALRALSSMEGGSFVNTCLKRSLRSMFPEMKKGSCGANLRRTAIQYGKPKRTGNDKKQQQSADDDELTGGDDDFESSKSSDRRGRKSQWIGTSGT